jgi:hypothetical protein
MMSPNEVGALGMIVDALRSQLANEPAVMEQRAQTDALFRKTRR